MVSAGFPAVAQETIIVDNTTRNFISYVPTALPDKAPLVISLHGMNQDAAYQRDQTQWNACADTAKFVVVYPNGNNKAWDISGTSDLRFIETVIDTMYERHRIDRNRVYLTGFSMGAMMTYHAMANLSHKIAAFGPVSGVPVDGRDPSGPYPVPIIHVHGTADNVVYYDGDANHVAGGYPSIPEYVRRWAVFDECDATPVTIKPYPAGNSSSAAAMTKYTEGKNGCEVALISIESKGHWHSNDPASVISTQEIWNFCKRYSLDTKFIDAPVLLSAEPENRSFDLVADADMSFVFTFDIPVKCSEVEATLISPADSYTLEPTGDDLSSTLTLRLPAQVTPADGTYLLSLGNVVSGEGGKMKTRTFEYTFGNTVVGEKPDTTMLLFTGWSAERETVGEGIPHGWMRSNRNSDGSKDEKGSGAADTGGARLKYFAKGGDFDAGFYFSARDYETCRFFYGAYSQYRLYLTPGDYVIDFNSIYWNAGAAEANATFDMKIFAQSGGSTPLNLEGLSSEGCLNETSEVAVSGSRPHHHVFTVTKEGYHIIDFNISQGWNAVILGDITVSTRQSAADEYKGTFTRLVNKAHALCRAAADGRHVQAEKMCDDMTAALEKYKDFASTSPSAYSAAIAELDIIYKPFATRMANIDEYLDAYDAAVTLLAKCSGNDACERLEGFAALSNAVSEYGPEAMSDADDARLEKAAAELRSCTAALDGAITGVATVRKDAVPVSTYYFSFDGRRTAQHDRKAVIVRKRYADGNTETTKSILK
ncbi:MAG: alpha/beta hydrolase family esterase, partial [Prevotella sp.]